MHKTIAKGLFYGVATVLILWTASLTYSFVEAVEASYPGYVVRFIGGAIFFSGMLVMAYNVYMTSRKGVEPLAVPATA